MYILYDRPNILFLGYNHGGYQFALHCDNDEEPTIIKLNRLKYVCGDSGVYYCERGGSITKNWVPIGEKELKSIVNNQKRNSTSTFVSNIKKYYNISLGSEAL